MPKPPSQQELDCWPHMVRWFNPVLLAKLLLQVIIADVFGQYADRRLIQAALDTVSKESLRERANLSSQVQSDPDGAIWFDYVSDLGDGFDATYAVAYLIAQKAVQVDGYTLPKGAALIMGGDEVYPTAGRDEYQKRMLTPYRLASIKPSGNRLSPILLIPGNHDWYDGLVTFLALFCREKPTSIGNWQTTQRRSYFAAKLTDRCWVWGIDIALTEDMDQPQADYFVAIAENMPEGASVILCTAVPGWYEADKKVGSYRCLSYAAWIAENSRKSLKIPLVLSGDTHHYCRYSSSASGTQFITSGGGGAFLHGTHQLRDEIKAVWLHERQATLSLRTDPGEHHHPTDKPACYPSKEVSRRLLARNFAFPIFNWDFAILLGVIYWILAFALTEFPRNDIRVIVFSVLAIGFCSYSGYQESWSPKVIALSLVNAMAHFLVLWLLATLFLRIDMKLWGLYEHSWWAWLFELAAPMVPLGGLLAGFIFGANLFLASRFANMSHNDAFSAMRLDSFRHFLRIRVAPDSITVYPIGLDSVPNRNGWQASIDPTGSVLEPREPLRPRLIEKPVIIRIREAVVTEEVKTPAEVSADQENDDPTI